MSGPAVTDGTAISLTGAGTVTVRATQPGPVWLSVEGPGVPATVLATQQAGPASAPVQAGGGLLGYRLQAPGRYVFSASAEAGRCRPVACAQQVVEVE